MLDPKNTVIRDRLSLDRIIHIDHHIRNIIDTKPFQRLRFVRQNGLASYVFPGAEHSRFSHSLGVYNNASRIFYSLQNKVESLDISIPPLRFDNFAERDFQVAALLHDIGHTAFSHVLEQDLLPNNFRNHEECTVYLILNDPELRKSISNCADIDSVVALIKGDHPNNVLNNLISGPFDVDRADYIRRDSEYCGVEYGIFDLSWLIHSIRIDLDQNQEPYLSFDGPRGIEALRQFLASRRHMYRHVYLHPTIRAAQVLLRSIFQRIFEIDDITKVVTHVPHEFKFLKEKRKPNIDEFLCVTDMNIHVFIQMILVDSSDLILKNLAKFFVRRDFPKSIIDSTKLSRSATDIYRINSLLNRSDVIQSDLFSDNEETISEFLESIRHISSKKLESIGIPGELSKYVIAYDRCEYISVVPDSYRFRFGDSYLRLSELPEAVTGFGTETWSEKFVIERFFGPGAIAEALRDHVRTRYVRPVNGLAR